MHTFLRTTMMLASVIAAFPHPSRAQCSQLDGGFGLPGPNEVVDATAMFDDGSGPRLYVGGFFYTAGSAIAQNVAKWDGATWSSVGDGLISGRVRALTVFDDGSGAALYAGGDFDIVGGRAAGGVGKWNGTSWSPVGAVDLTVRALAVFDDGTGPALFAAGDFTLSEGTSVNRIAKWNGTEWTPLGGGIGTSASNKVHSLAVFDDGSGPALYAGGSFAIADGVAAANIARWNGTSWSAVGSGRSAPVFALAPFDDGSGASLFVGGSFSSGGQNNIARWNGSSWSAVGGGANDDVLAITTYDDGGGTALYAGGWFTIAGGVPASRIAKWNGSTWSALDSGIRSESSGPEVKALCVGDLGSGSSLYAGGDFKGTEEIGASHIAAWDGTDWHALGNGNGLSFAPEALITFDDGSGTALFAGGLFLSAGDVAVNGVAEWDGTNWSPVGSGVDDAVKALATYDDGSGLALYAAGRFTIAGGVSASNIAKWNGSSWSALGSGIEDGTVAALVVFDDGSGPKLHAAGSFTSAGGVTVPKIASWDGSSWAPVGIDTASGIARLAVFDDGTGDALYACGSFTSIGGTSANRIARWNGTSWSALGSGLNSQALDMLVFDDGSGAALYVGGTFSVVEGLTMNGIARWNGTAWSGVGGGTNSGGSVGSMIAFDDGSGPSLYVSGGLTSAGGVPVNKLAKWDGASWSWPGVDLDAPFETMAVFEDGADGAPDLYGSGDFFSSSGLATAGIAELHGCPPGTAYCFGDGLDPIVTAQCPCTNFGDPGHGCANSNPALGGARLWATGTTSPNTLLFYCEGIPNNALATFWRGTANTPGGGVVHDGIQCLGGTTIRFGQQNAGQLGNPPFTISAGTVALAPGSTRYYQVLYRNPAPSFCPPGTYNFSNGYIVTW